MIGELCIYDRAAPQLLVHFFVDSALACMAPGEMCFSIGRGEKALAIDTCMGKGRPDYGQVTASESFNSCIIFS